MTTVDVEYICPFCENKFEYIAESSHYQGGVFLDFKPYGAMAVPGFLPQCPKCNFVFLADLFLQNEIIQIKSLLNDNNIYQKEPGMPKYYYLAKMCELVNISIDGIIYFFHSAIWEDKSCFDFVSDIMINYFDNIDCTNKNYYIYKIIKLDFLRRKGENTKAIELINEINNDSNFPLTKEVKTLLEYQYELINNNDVEEHQWPRNKEDIEKREKFDNFLETTSLSITVSCNSINRNLLEVLHKLTLLKKSFIYQKIKNNLPLLECSIDFGVYPNNFFYKLEKLKNIDVDVLININFKDNIKCIDLAEINNDNLLNLKVFQQYIYSKYYIQEVPHERGTIRIALD